MLLLRNNSIRTVVLLSFLHHTEAFSSLLNSFWAPENEVGSIEDVSSNVEIRKLEAAADFSPLSCNTDLSTCVNWPFGNNAGAIEIGCNECYSMGAYRGGETITLTGPLDIKGKLVFPDGSKVKLVVPGIIVQGELEMTSTKVIDGNPDIVFDFVGSDDVYFTPDPENAVACNGSSCNLGPKPFVVAGGKLNINGIPDTCPTWTNVKDIVSSGVPLPTNYPKQPTLPEGCSDVLIVEDFEFGEREWSGNAGAEAYIMKDDFDGNYLRVTNRKHAYQGPMIDLSKYQKECLLTDTDYLISAKIRISPQPGAKSNCYSDATDCPKIQFSNMDAAGIVRWRELLTIDRDSMDYVVDDNEWFEVRQQIKIDSPAIIADPSDVFSLFTINGVEPGVDIDVDDITLSLPPVSSFPDPSNVCSDLVLNGDAEGSEFAYPFRSYLTQNNLVVKEEDDNKFFSLTNRQEYYDSITYDLTPGCLQTGAVYSFSAKIRLHSTNPVIPKVRLVSKIPGNPTLSFDEVQDSCPQVSMDDGWTTCSGDFTASSHLSTAASVRFLIMFPLDSTHDVDFDDISIAFKHTAGAGIELTDSDNVDSCYTSGAEVLIPSVDLGFDSIQTRNVKDVLKSGSSSIVQFDEDITRVTTATENSDFAAEFAFLSRNILFKNGGADNVGPSLTILNTPGITQKITGVELNGFGQESISGSHPINFKMSGDSMSSVIGKNTIRNSNNRCINIDSTDSVNIEENVAFNTIGHCFAVENGVGNTFYGNLGSVTKKPTADDDTDAESSTFFITNPDNTYIGNVAAGSERNGFWFKLSDASQGVFGAFADNTAHSNSFFGIRTYSSTGMQPTETTIWTNTKSYKNLVHSIIFHMSRNIILEGGIVADNRIGIDLWQNDNIQISNMRVQGYTSSFKNIADNVPSTIRHCTSITGAPLVGIRLHPNAMTEGQDGTVINEVDFSGFTSSNGCNPSSTAIGFNGNNIDPHSYTTSISISGASFDSISESMNEISLCGLHDTNVTDVALIDSDGSLNSIELDLGDGPGVVVSNNAHMGRIGRCETMGGTCAKYCVDVDMGILYPTQEDSVTDSAPTDTTESTPTNDSSESTPTDTTTGSTTDTTPGESSTDSTGEASIVTGDGICLENLDFEDGSNKWIAKNSIATEVSGVGLSSKGLKSYNRKHQARGGISQVFSTSCLEAGQWYELTADVKLTNAGSASIFTCDPTTRFYTDKTCAITSLLIGNALEEVAFTVGPHVDGWNKMYGVFEATDSIMAQSEITLYISGASTSADITVDNVIIQKAAPNALGVTDCTNPIINGDAESGDHRGWWIRGHGGNGVIEMGEPGYSGSYSFKHTGVRNDKLYSMFSVLDNSCFSEGSQWRILAKFRYFDREGNFVACVKDDITAANACPVFSVYEATSDSTGPMDNEITSEMAVGEWNDIQITFTISSSMASQNSMWINVISGAGNNYELDDISLVEIV